MPELSLLGRSEGLQALKRRLQSQLGPERGDAPAPAAAAEAPGREEEPRSESFDVDVMHDDEAGSDDALSMCAPRWVLHSDATCMHSAPHRSAFDLLNRHMPVPLRSCLVGAAALGSTEGLCEPVYDT